MSNAANITNAYTLYCNPNGARRLAKDFQPGKYDVLCARGKRAHESEGNRRFRALVKLHQEKYAACTCKVEKSKIVSHIVKTVRHASPEGGFVKNIDGEFWEVGDRAAKEKVGQTFRDLLHTKYSSSTKAKARARIERKEQEQNAMATGRHQFVQRQPMSSPDYSATSVVSDDSFSNHEDNSSFGQLSPIPQRSVYVDTSSLFQPEPINLIQTIEPNNVYSSFRRSNSNNRRNSLLRSSIHTIDESHNNMLRSSIHSFAGNGLEGAEFNVAVPRWSVVENEFATSNMEMDDLHTHMDFDDIVAV